MRAPAAAPPGPPGSGDALPLEAALLAPLGALLPCRCCCRLRPPAAKPLTTSKAWRSRRSGGSSATMARSTRSVMPAASRRGAADGRRRCRKASSLQ